MWRNNRHPNRRFLLSVLGSRWLLLALLGFSPALSRADPRCERVDFSVTLAPGQSTTYQVAGWLCSQGSFAHQTLQLLIHGFSFSHLYWDPPLNPALYSYVRYATDAGYATLNIDRIGNGLSDHPPADQVTTVANAFVIHQIVQTMRAGITVPTLGQVRTERVILVGHSLGSIISSVEAATYQDVDGLILSAFSHTLGPLIPFLESNVYPAQLDPRFANSNLPAGYLTTRPGIRGQTFYYQPTADPAVIAFDEANKETGTSGEFVDFVPSISSTPGIQVPVFEAVGDFDLLFCSGPSCTQSHTLAGEDQFFSPRACLEKFAFPAIAHALNLHANAAEWFVAAQLWADRHIGADTRLSPLNPCQ